MLVAQNKTVFGCDMPDDGSSFGETRCRSNMGADFDRAGADKYLCHVANEQGARDNAGAALPIGAGPCAAALQLEADVGRVEGDGCRACPAAAWVAGAQQRPVRKPRLYQRSR